MEPSEVLQMFFVYLPRVFLAVTGLLLGILISGPLVDQVLPRFYGKKLTPRNANYVRWATTLGLSLLCFLLAGSFGLGGGGSGKSGPGDVSNTVKADGEAQGKEVAPVLIAENPKKPKVVGLKMRVLGPNLAKEYSGKDHSPNNLFWFEEVTSAPEGNGFTANGKSKPVLLDWESAKTRIQGWKSGQPPVRLNPIKFLYSTQDPDDSSPLVSEVSRWCREQGLSLERQTTMEGLP